MSKVEDKKDWNEQVAPVLYEQALLLRAILDARDGINESQVIDSDVAEMLRKRWDNLYEG